LREYTVCYTLENEIKQERIFKEKEVKRNEVIQEVHEKILNQNSFMAKSDQGDYWINTSSIRYVRVL
jgi:D-Tyr-tRNAtyr deacylase